MTRRRRLLITFAAVILAIAGSLGRYAYLEYRKAEFIRDLHPVGFSTSLIGAPYAETELAA